jgi:hypothetical protein
MAVAQFKLRVIITLFFLISSSLFVNAQQMDNDELKSMEKKQCRF